MNDVVSELADISTLTLLDDVDAGGEGLTEGPLWHPEGYLTYVRHRIGQLYRWDPDAEKATLIRENTGRSSAHTFDVENRLVMCEGGNRRMTRIERGGAHGIPAEDWPLEATAITGRWQGKQINKPNDVVCRSDGSIYFTDPQSKASSRELGFSAVFRIAPDGELQLGTDGCEDPNGLAFSPDESVLYVAISRRDEHCVEEMDRGEFCPHRMIRAFDVLADGSLVNNRVFADMYAPGPGVPDGMKVDSAGRIYCTGTGGLWVYDPDGTLLGIIPMPIKARNLAFGGPDLRTLYICAGQRLYSLQMHVAGIAAFWS